MRLVKEASAWDTAKRRQAGLPSRQLTLPGIGAVDLDGPCTVIGGGNGVGKSRVLRAMAEGIGASALYLDMHRLCEVALAITRKRDDLDDMAMETGPLAMPAARRADVQRVLRREYDQVDWYALEFGPPDEDEPLGFPWVEDQTYMPYFKAVYRGVDFGSSEMGLGEFSVHFLFWILEMCKERKDVVLILDEPDAYLPPIGVASLLHRLIALCADRGWSLVLSTHSGEIIEESASHGAFLLVEVDSGGVSTAQRCDARSPALDSVILRRPVRRVVFVEDESACYFASALLEAGDRRAWTETEFVWGSGNGDLTRLARHLPRRADSEILFAVAFDGDQRNGGGGGPASKWPVLYLPTDEDPDALLMALRADLDTLAEALGAPGIEVARALAGLEGFDKHDWVNGLGVKFGRARVLAALTRLWAARNANDVSDFTRSLLF